MCFALPMCVIELNEEGGICELEGCKSQVNLDLVQGVQPGEYVLVHTGCAIQVIDEDEAAKTQELYQQMAEIMDETPEKSSD